MQSCPDPAHTCILLSALQSEACNERTHPEGCAAWHLMIRQGRAVDLVHLCSETRPMIAVSPVLPVREEVGMDHLVQESILH